MSHWAKPRKKPVYLFDVNAIDADALAEAGRRPGTLVACDGPPATHVLKIYVKNPQPRRFVSHAPKVTASKRPDKPLMRVRGFAQ